VNVARSGDGPEPVSVVRTWGKGEGSDVVLDGESIRRRNCDVEALGVAIVGGR
jgi:hypothetical protein